MSFQGWYMKILRLQLLLSDNMYRNIYNFSFFVFNKNLVAINFIFLQSFDTEEYYTNDKNYIIRK